MPHTLSILQGHFETFLACQLFILRVPIVMKDNYKLYTRICCAFACGKRQQSEWLASTYVDTDPISLPCVKP